MDRAFPVLQPQPATLGRRYRWCTSRPTVDALLQGRYQSLRDGHRSAAGLGFRVAFYQPAPDLGERAADTKPARVQVYILDVQSRELAEAQPRVGEDQHDVSLSPTCFCQRGDLSGRQV